MKGFKRCLCVILALTLAVALFAGCGKEEQESNPNTQQEASAEYVYVPEYIDISGKFTGGFGNVVYAGEYLYTTSNEMIEDRTPEGVTPQYESEYWVYGTVIYKIGLDGSCEKLNYKPDTLPEGVQGGIYVNDMLVGDDGTIYLLENVYTYSYNAPEGIDETSEEYWSYYESSETYNLKAVAPDGSVVSTTELSELGADQDYFYPYGFAIDGDGNIYLCSDTILYVLDKTGALQFTIEAESWMNDVIVLSDGRVACSNYGETGYQLSVVDLQAKAFGENLPVPNNGYDMVPGGGDYDFYYTNGSNFYGYDLESGESTKLLNWINCDVDNYNISGVNVLADGRVVCVSGQWNSDYTERTNELVVLTKQPASSVPQKTTLTLATQYLDYNVRSQIIEFNKTNDQYRIEVRDYSEYNTEEDYSAGLTKLTTEILTGNMPDILDLNGIPLDQLAAKGVLEDLYPYLDQDSEIGREDLMPSVLSSLETDGKLYTTCSGFYVFTAIGASSVVGDTPGWTVDEFNAALATMPEGCTAFDKYVTRDDILYYCMALDADSFVDWSTGKCSFDSEAFVKMLEFVKSFPSEFDWESYEYSEEDSTPTRIANGQQMLIMTSVSDFTDFQMYKAMFGGSITYVGFPTEYGTGNMLSTNSGYAMSSKCSNKDAAWQFLRQFFTEEYQEKNVWSFPSNVNAFNTKLEEAMTPEYEKDENGNYVLDENGEKIEVSHGGWSWGSVSIELYAITQEEADDILELINSTTKAMKADESITDIVKEQAAAFFEGQKSAEEVAKLVQSKASIYVNEQR